MNNQLTTVAAYPGAKSRTIGNVIAAILPTSGIKEVLDVFGGMGNLIVKYSGKANDKRVYYNDINPKHVKLFQVLCSEYAKALFIRILKTTNYTEVDFNYARFVSNFMLDDNGTFMKNYGFNHQLDDIQKAAEVWANVLLSFNGKMNEWGGITRGNEAIQYKDNIIKKYDLIDIFKDVRVLNMDGFEIIKQKKYCKDTLLICDSPYTKDEMTSKAIYECEMTQTQQYEYATLLCDATAKVLVCGYKNKIYDSILTEENGWHYHQLMEVPKSMSTQGLGVSKSKAIESVWVNYDIKNI